MCNTKHPCIYVVYFVTLTIVLDVVPLCICYCAVNLLVVVSNPPLHVSALDAWTCSLHVCGIVKVRRYVCYLENEKMRYIRRSKPYTNSNKVSSAHDEYGEVGDEV